MHDVVETYGTPHACIGHLGVACVNRHPRPDGRLGEVHRSDVAGLEVGEGGGEFGLECGDELPSGGEGGVVRARATDQDDAGGEGVGAHADHAVAEFSAHGPSASNSETSANHGVKESLPPGAGGTCLAFGFGLLEGVVDGDGEAGMCLLGQPRHSLSHTGHKEGSCSFLTPVAVRGGHQLFGLRHGDGGKEIRKNRPQRVAQPDVEEVR